MQKLQELKDIVNSFNEDEISYLEEKDKQFLALKNLYENLKDDVLFFKLVIINALMSYQLQMKGEDYWEIFSKFFSKNKDISFFESFIKTYNKRFLNAKLKRLKKVINCVEKLFFSYSPKNLGENLEKLINFLSLCLNQDKRAKTIVFAAKMFMYAYKIVYKKYPKNIENIFIPLDSRLKKIDSNKENWENFLKEVSHPPLRLDVILWLPQNLSLKEISNFPPSLREKLIKIKRVLNS